MAYVSPTLRSVGDPVTAADQNIVANDLVDSGWVTPSYLNSWSTYVTASAYRRIGNRLFIRGGVQGGTGGTSAFTLPTGFRPQTQLEFACQNGNAVLSSTTKVTVGGNGVVQPESNTYGVFLDMISFLVD